MLIKLKIYLLYWYFQQNQCLNIKNMLYTTYTDQHGAVMLVRPQGNYANALRRHCLFIVENETPTISIVSGNNRINAEVNSSIEMVFTGQDDKTFFYDIINQPVAGFIADNSTGNLSLRWTPANVNAERIRQFVSFVKAFFKWIYIYICLKIKPNSVRIRFLSCQNVFLPSTGFELTPLIHCSTIRLALCPAPSTTSTRPHFYIAKPAHVVTFFLSCHSKFHMN